LNINQDFYEKTNDYSTFESLIEQLPNLREKSNTIHVALVGNPNAVKRLFLTIAPDFQSMLATTAELRSI
jgi:hypothetical protein